jgi:hypothetical protein
MRFATYGAQTPQRLATVAGAIHPRLIQLKSPHGYRYERLRNFD